jgi:hypothetical protein
MSIRSFLPSLWGAASTTFNGSAFPYRQHVATRLDPVELPPAALYAVLRLFDLSNGVYDDLASASVTIGRATPTVKAIRNPVPAVCNAWEAKLWPEPLAIVTENTTITDPLEMVWRWSNWRASRPKVARWTALYGEAWIKVQADQRLGRVWFEYLEPAYVRFVRVDIPKAEETDTGWKQTVLTEVWDAGAQIQRTWVTEGTLDQVAGRRLKDLGAPSEETPFSAYGIDFVPFVRIPFSDSGESRGIGAIQRALEPIAEADLSATNLHAMVYQDAEGAWVVKANGTLPDGRPIPPMQVANAAPTFDALGRQTGNGTGLQSDGTVDVGKRSFWRLPGGYELQSVVPDINYLGALAVLQDHDTALERLLPALAYARISEMGGADLSGRAIRFKLTPFIDQVTGVRATALEKLEQADMMALTLGKVNAIPGFQGIGDFESGAFAHDFEDRDIIPLSDLEHAESEQMRATAYGAWRTAGLPDVEALQRVGYSKADAARIARLATKESEQALERQQTLMAEQGDTGEEDDDVE